jgi:hypothetical protein
MDMGTRERVSAAVEAPTAAAARLLEELRDTDEHEKLAILINGWGRALAAALEELALAVDAIARPDAEPPDQPRRPRAPNEPEPPPEASLDEAPPAGAPAGEAELAQRARESRAATAELRDESGA